MSFLMTVNQLENSMQNNERDVAIVDVRYQLNNPAAGRVAYQKGHIPGAVYLDLKEDLSSEAKQHGGSHPLPDKDVLASKLGELGIDHDTLVVIYGEKNDMFSARCLWLFHYLGHENAYILDGGLAKWLQEGNEITTDTPQRKAKTFKPSSFENKIVNMQDVKQKMDDKPAVLIDSRSKDRYLGKTEPLYGRAGHIPGAKNYFWKDVLDAEGNWKDNEELERHFSDLSKSDEIIVSCGSGVSACPNILALKRAGFTNVKLYPGSFSDWISYDENPLETKEE